MTALERYVAAYAERFGRPPRRTPEFREPLPSRVNPFPGAGVTTHTHTEGVAR